MGQIILRLQYLIFLTVILNLSLLWAKPFSAPQVTFGLGTADFCRNEFPYAGNYAQLEYTRMAFSRLQFGLKYDATSAIIDKRTTYQDSGLMLTTKLILETLAKKSPYFGFNFGWLNATLANERVIYQARGVFSGESLIGYTYRLNDYSRVNIEYRDRYLQLDQDELQIQRYSLWLFSYSYIFNSRERQAKKKGISKVEAQQVKKEYLQDKLKNNYLLIQKYDTLINKYNQKIYEDGTDKKSVAEREYLTQEKTKLQQENQEIRELLAL